MLDDESPPLGKSVKTEIVLQSREVKLTDQTMRNSMSDEDSRYELIDFTSNFVPSPVHKRILQSKLLFASMLIVVNL